MQKYILIITLVFLLAMNSWGQMYLADIQFDKINEVSVEQYLHRQIDNNTQTFSDVKPSLSPTSSIEGYRLQEGEYVIKDSLAKVWNHYLYTNPGDAWNAGKLNFGMMFSKEENEVVYADEQVAKIETGQIVYLNLFLLKLKNIATAFEITKVDEQRKVIEFSYIDDNVTSGKQRLTFVQTPKGFTKIIHRSYFKSESVLRDHFLYPYFHTRMTNTYHRNMKRMYNDTHLN